MTNSSLPSGLLGPALRFMQSMRLTSKLALVGLLTSVPLAFMTGQAVIVKNDLMQTARNERTGAAALTALLEVTVQAQKHRSQTNVVLSGNTAAAAQLAPTRQALREAMDRLDKALQARPDWKLLPAWNETRQALEPLSAGQHGTDRAQVFRQHSDQIEALRRLALRLGEASEMLFDPAPATYFLADTAVDRLLPWTEAIAQLRGQGAGLLARGEASPAELAQMHKRIGQLETHLNGVQDMRDALERTGESPDAAWAEALTRSRAFLKTASERFASADLQGASATDFFADGTQTIETVGQLEKKTVARLGTLLGERERQLTWERDASAALALAGLALLSYLGAAFYRSTLFALRRVEAAARAGAEGDLTVKANVPGRDEFADMGREIDQMTAQLTRMVGEIRRHADQVAASGDQMARDSSELSQRTTEQAASVEQSSASLSQVAQAVRSNDEQVAEVNGLFGEVRHAVRGGAERMQAVVETMGNIEAASKRVTDIVGVIDGIAFQTNILALNAAVEAARAGEAGRGFAVVATEVRNLAGRCSVAAGEIRSLIGASSTQVEIGVGQIHETRDNLDQLLEQASRVDAALASLAQSTQQQTQGVDQVNDGVRIIGEMTMGNAQSVEVAATLAQELQGHASELQSLVAALKVPEDGMGGGSTGAAHTSQRSALTAAVWA